MGDQPDYVRTEAPVPAPEGTVSAHELTIRDIVAQYHDTIGGPAADFLRERERYGVEKYGTVLWEGDGRPADKDALDEAGDLVVYLRNWINKLHAEGEERRAATLLVIYHGVLRTFVELAHTAAAWKEADSRD